MIYNETDERSIPNVIFGSMTGIVENTRGTAASQCFIIGIDFL